MSRAIFEVESDPLHYSQALANHEMEPPLKNLSHTSVIKNACHFWIVGLSLAEMSFRVDYNATTLIPSIHCGAGVQWTTFLVSKQKRKFMGSSFRTQDTIRSSDWNKRV